jgi:hypothetical protein
MGSWWESLGRKTRIRDPDRGREAIGRLAERRGPWFWSTIIEMGVSAMGLVVVEKQLEDCWRTVREVRGER